MTRPTLLLVTVVLAITFALTHAGTIRERRQAIPREFQNVNIENYLKNPRAVQFQLKCVIDEGPCDRIGKYLKVTIPELLTNQCRNCSPDQRRQAGRLVAYIQQNYKKEWAAAVKKFQGGAISDAEIHRFEQDYGVKIDGVSTETPAGEGVPASNAPVTLDEISSIVKDFKANAPKLEFTKPLPGTPEHAAAAKAAAAAPAAPAAVAAPAAPAAVAAPAAA